MTEKQDNENDDENLPYILPSWRLNEIIMSVVRLFSEEEYYREDFDYKKMISDKGIVIKKYSSFKKENLQAMYDASLSLWKEGLCLVFPSDESGKLCRMIAYNDKKNAAEIMQIIFHEYAHMLFKHTQQSAHGEAEANCFAIIATFILLLENQFHIGRIIAQGGGQMLKQGLLNQMQRMEVK